MQKSEAKNLREEESKVFSRKLEVFMCDGLQFSDGSQCEEGGSSSFNRIELYFLCGCFFVFNHGDDIHSPRFPCSPFIAPGWFLSHAVRPTMISDFSSLHLCSFITTAFIKLFLFILFYFLQLFFIKTSRFSNNVEMKEKKNLTK